MTGEVLAALKAAPEPECLVSSCSDDTLPVRTTAHVQDPALVTTHLPNLRQPHGNITVVAATAVLGVTGVARLPFPQAEGVGGVAMAGQEFSVASRPNQTTHLPERDREEQRGTRNV